MAFAAPTQLATQSNNASGQTSWATGSIVFPTTGQAVLGIMMLAISGTATAETFTVSDSASNTWTVVAIADNTGTSGAHTAVAYFLYPSGGSNTTVTVTGSWGTSVTEVFGWCGYTTGHNTTTPVDKTGTLIGGGADTSDVITTSGALGTDNDLALYVFTVGNNNSGPTGYPGTGWTGLSNPLDTTRHRVGAFAYDILTGGSGSTLSTASLSFAGSSITPPTGSIVTFSPAGGGSNKAITPAAINATSAVSSTVQALHQIAGSITASSAVTATVQALQQIVTAAINSTSAVTAAVSSVTRMLPSAITASSAVTASIQALHQISGAVINATSDMTAAVTGGAQSALQFMNRVIRWHHRH